MTVGITADYREQHMREHLLATHQAIHELAKVTDTPLMMVTRPDWDTYFLALAKAVSARADCRRRTVGCVLVDADHRVISTGYNGAEPGGPSCLAGECPRGAPELRGARRHHHVVRRRPWPLHIDSRGDQRPALREDQLQGRNRIHHRPTLPDVQQGTAGCWHRKDRPPVTSRHELASSVAETVTHRLRSEIDWQIRMAFCDLDAYQAGYADGQADAHSKEPAMSTVGEVMLKIAGWIDSAQLPMHDEHHRAEALTRRRLAQILREGASRPFGRQSILDAVNETEGFGE